MQSEQCIGETHFCGKGDITCKQCVQGNTESSSSSDEVQPNQPILSAVQVNVKIVLCVLDVFGCMQAYKQQSERLTCNNAVQSNAE